MTLATVAGCSVKKQPYTERSTGRCSSLARRCGRRRRKRAAITCVRGLARSRRGVETASMRLSSWLEMVRNMAISRSVRLLQKPSSITAGKLKEKLSVPESGSRQVSEHTGPAQKTAAVSNARPDHRRQVRACCNRRLLQRHGEAEWREERLLESEPDGDELVSLDLLPAAKKAALRESQSGRT
jgi:hypothetical protein